MLTFKQKTLVLIAAVSVGTLFSQTTTYFMMQYMGADDRATWTAVFQATWLPLFIISAVVLLFFKLLNNIEVTQKKLKITQQHSRENEVKFRSLFEMSPVGIALNKMSGEFVEVNNALLEMTGYDYETFVKLTYWEITPKKYEAQEAVQLESIQNRGIYGPYEKEYIHKDGHNFEVLLNGVVIENAEGEQFIWSIIQDISYQEKVKRDIIKANEKAQMASAAKSVFLANMSHEIRTPLNAIIGFIDKLLSIEKDEEKRKYLGIVNNSSHALMGIINDVLDISKIENKKLILEKESFELHQALESVSFLFQALIDEKLLHFRMNISEAVPHWVEGDSLRFKQVLNNLLSNAIKFTNREGHIDIDVDYKDDQLFIKVSDDGRGMSKKVMETIFEAFIQADASTSREFGGTGLGLHIVKELVLMMGGDIHVSSEEGKGSCFEFDVRLKSCEEQETKALSDSEGIGEGKILVAEDNKTNQLLISMILDDLEIPHLIKENGQELLDALEGFKPDLILMDINMPVMNGLEATQHIREDATYANFNAIPIIALTANALKGDRARFIEEGMNDYVSKPIELEKLKLVLHEYLSK